VALADFSTKFTPIPATVLDDYAMQVFRQVITDTDLHEPLWREHFTRLRQFAEAGYGRKFTDAANFWEFEKFQQMQLNLAHFAGHKQQALTEELRRLLLDAKGNKLPLSKFQEAAADILKLHNVTYLRAELTTATQVGQAVESWQEIQRRKAIYPNLRYDTAGDARVRPKHVLLDGATHPVDSPFWDTHYPPNGWRCRCKVLQTDEPENGKIANFQPDKGFRQNAGKTGKIFGDDHPYFDVTTLDAERVQSQANNYLAALDKADTTKLAIARYAGDRLAFPAGLVDITDSAINALVAQAHELEAIRNNLLTAFKLILPELKAAGETLSNSPEHPNWTKFVHYALDLIGEVFYLNIRQVRVAEGEYIYQLHSITSTI